MGEEQRLLNLLQRSSAAGLPRHECTGEAASSVPGSTSQTPIQEVQVIWKVILQNVISKHRGAAAIYETKEIDGNKFVSSITFRFPLDSNVSKFKNISCTSFQHPFLWEAESEAAAMALQCLTWGPLCCSVVDISQIRVDEMEETCNVMLRNTKKMIRRCKADLENWCEGICKTEACHSSLHENMLTSFPSAADRSSRQKMEDAAAIIIAMENRHELQLKSLTLQMKECKKRAEDLYSAMVADLHPWLVPKTHQYAECADNEIRISAQVILTQMIKSTRSDNLSEEELHDMSSLFANFIDIGRQSGKEDAGTASKEPSADEITEDDRIAANAILYAENELSLYVVDLNYNKRALLEKYVVQATAIEQQTKSTAKAINDTWGALVAQIGFFNMLNKERVSNHRVQGRNDTLYMAKCACAEVVAQLFRDCLFDMQVASFDDYLG